MMSDRSLQWLRSALGDVPSPGPAGDERTVAMALAAALLARRTPAWTEHHVAILDALLARTPDPGPLRLLLIELRHGVAADATLAAEAATLRSPTAAALEQADLTATHDALARLALLAHDHGTARGRVGTAPRAVSPTQAVEGGADTLHLAVLLAPHTPRAARDVFDAARSAPLPSARAAAYALLLAREWGLADLFDDLRTAATDPAGDPVAAALVAAADAAGPEPGKLTALFREPLAALPQVVGVDVPTMALARAEWLHDCLCLELAPAELQPTKFTQFLIVGTELRVWCQTGVDGVRTDVTGHGVVVRAPLVGGPLEFTPGSY